MKDPYLDSVLELLASGALNPEGPHLITVDELRAAGALDVPKGWRTSLGDERRPAASLFADEDSAEDFSSEGTFVDDKVVHDDEHE